MQGTVILRTLGVLALAASLGAAMPARAARPDKRRCRALTVGPGDKYFAKTDAKTHGVSFAVWANGRPIGVIDWPSKSLDITKGMRGHANVVVVQWTRTQKNGSGTLTVGTAKKTVFTTTVTPSSPAKGRHSKQFIAPQAPIGR